MKKILIVLLSFLLLSGCTQGKEVISSNISYTSELINFETKDKIDLKSDNEQFDEFIKDFTIESLKKMDFITSTSFINKPENFGLSEKKGGMESISYEFDKETYDFYLSYLEKLKIFDYNDLSKAQQYLYDSLEYSLYETLASLENYRYDLAFSKRNDLIANTFFTLADIDLNSEQRVISYLETIATLDDYFKSLIDYTKKQYEEGIYTSDEALDYSISMIESILSKGDNNSLILTFNNRLAELKEVKDSQKYIEQNYDLVMNELFPYLKEMIEELKALKGREQTYTYELSDEYKDMLYALNCSTNDSLTDILNLLIDTYNDILEKAQNALENPSSLERLQVYYDDPLFQLDEKEMLEHIILQMEKERGLDRSAAIADMRYAYIKKVSQACVTKPKTSKERERSEKIDRILTGKYTAIPFFILIMGCVFYLTFNVIGSFLQNLLETGIDSLTVYIDSLLTFYQVNESIHRLIIDGIFTGIGSVVSFLPIIVTLFFFLSLMEDSGYIARVAFVMDKLLRKIGLSGRSIVPLLIGFGCTVPAVMSTRTLPSERDRKMTILLTPFMSCTAKLPVYAFFVNAFFKDYAGWIMTGLYFMGILVGILIAFLYKNTLFKGEAVPFVMELPNYRMPSAKNVGQLLWEKAKDFLQKAFSVILLATVVIWFLQSYDFHFNYVLDSKDSMLSWLSSSLIFLFKPIGLSDWRICTSLISGIMAKESVVSTLQVLYQGNITQVFSAASAASMLVFSLLYSPCIAAVASIKRELGNRWAIGVVIWQCLIAWICAFLVYHIVLLM